MRQRIEPAQHTIHRPADNEPRERNHNHDRRRYPYRGAPDDFRTNFFALGNLHGPLAITRRVDVPHLAISFDVGKAGLALERDLDTGKRLMNDSALLIPNGDGELVLRIVVGCRRSVDCGYAGSSVESDLTQLTIQELVSFPTNIAVSDQDGDKSDDRKQTCHPDQSGPPQRRRHDFRTIHQRLGR